MINYSTQTERSLEFHLVIDQIYQCFQSAYGKNYFQKNYVLKTRSKEEIERSYLYLKEYSFLKILFPDFGVKHIFDLNVHIGKLAIENYYIPKEDLFSLYLLLCDIHKIKLFFQDVTYQKEIASLSIKVDKLFYERSLRRELEKIMDEEGNIRASASKALAAIYDRKKTIQSDIDRAFMRA